MRVLSLLFEIILFTFLLVHCSQPQKELILSETNDILENDTIHYGSYFGITNTEVFLIRIKDLEGKEIMQFVDDSVYNVSIVMDYKKEYPLKVISLNGNAAIQNIPGGANQYSIKVNKKNPPVNGFEVALGILPDPSAPQLVYHGKYLADSLNVAREWYMVRDTFAIEYLRIK